MDERVRAAADALRRAALDEGAKARVAADPVLTALARRVADRYVAGTAMGDALARAGEVNAAGHLATIDHMGESARDAAVADAATEEFVRLAAAIAAAGLRCSVSLDLSHLGSTVDRDLGRANAARVAAATRDAGVELLISMEGHDRVDQILEDHAWLAADHDHVGVTVQARLHRTPADLDALLTRPGRIRLVKGAYDTPAALAHAREDAATLAAFDDLAAALLRSGHPCAIATHDPDRIARAAAVVDAAGLRGGPYLFEVLGGLGRDRIDALRAAGHPTQEYLVYGTESWLYVCNRLAEDPTRVFQALADAVP